MALAFTAPRAEATTFLRLYRDESKIIRVDGLKRVSVTNPSIATPVIISPAEIMLNGLTVGRTSLYIWDENGRTEIQAVVRPFTDELQRKLEEDIDDPDVKIQVIAEGQNERVFLRGLVSSQGAYRNAIAVAGAYVGTGNVVDLLEVKGVSEDPLSQLTRLIDNRAVKVQIVTEPQAPGDSGSTPQISNIILEGYVDDQRDEERATAIAKSFVSGDESRITNLIEVVNPLQVLVEGHLLEMSRTENSQIGVTWGTAQATLSGTQATVGNFLPDQVSFLENFLFPTSRGPGGSGLSASPDSLSDLKRVDPIFASLQMQLSTGKGRVLHNPKVVTRSGETASIAVGGQVGIVTQGNFGNQQATFQDFGLKMEVTPNVDHRGNINTKVDIELSNPDATLGATLSGATIPGFRNRTTSNNVTVKDGEHIIISGLINKEEQELISKVPVLWKIPVLGRLFQNKRFQNLETELVVIITPHLLASKRLRERFYGGGSEASRKIAAGLDAQKSPQEIAQAFRSAEANQNMVREMFAGIQKNKNKNKKMVVAQRLSGNISVMSSRSGGGKVDPLTGEATQRPQGKAETSSDRIRRMLSARRRSGRGEQTRQALSRALPGVSRRLPSAGTSPREDLELASRPPSLLSEDPMAPPELPGLIPVKGTISGRIHGLFEEVESDPGFRKEPASVASGTGDEALDERVDDLFNQIKAKLGGGL
jgi:Flp pilus assembly secretin CpaC